MNNNICNNCLKNNEKNKKFGCIIDYSTLTPIKFPEPENPDFKVCRWVEPINGLTHENIIEENQQEIKFVNSNKDDLKNMEKYEPHVDMVPEVDDDLNKKLTDEEYKLAVELFHNKNKDAYNFNKIYEKLGIKYDDLIKDIEKRREEKEKEIHTPEDMLKGDIKIAHLNQVTSWKRVLNAARRTIGKEPTEKEPSDSWKAKILLAEHSPIRLLEYDFGWKNIRQWVTAHLVRHHEGCEKFVHSQRGDRRELPCDRDHIYQGSRNDMDMSANAQSIINISRKRLCNCASKETREAWKKFISELKNIDPILANKCVPECIYRGFCPEWMNSCKYYKTNEYKIALAKYRSTKFGKDIKYFCINQDDIKVLVSNTGHIYEIPDFLKDEKTGDISNKSIVYEIELKELKYDIAKWIISNELIVVNYRIPVSSLVVACFSENPLYRNARLMFGNPFIIPEDEIIEHIDDNIFNNDIDNLKTNGEY